ncbi:MAG: HDIG domain-containing protein [Chloroflexi bacterium]|nr:HDIG domain-containing protein [Chloroflexota bacterium]
MPLLRKRKTVSSGRTTSTVPGRGDRNSFWSQQFRLGVFCSALTVVLATVMVFQLMPSQVALEAGQVATNTVKAPAKVRFVSQILTAQAKQQAANDPANIVYDHDRTVAQASSKSLLDAISQVAKIRDNTLMALEDKVRTLTANANLGLGSDTARQMLQLTADDWRTVTAESTRVLDRVMAQPVYADQLTEARNQVSDMIGRDLSAAQANCVAALVRPFVNSNMVFNAQATQLRQDDAVAKVEPVYVEVEKGQAIIRDGEVVKPTDLETLEALGLRQPAISWQEIIGTYGVVALLMLGLFLYILHFGEQVLVRQRLLLMLGIVMFLTVVGAKFAIPGHAILAYMFPLAAVSMLLAVLLDVRLALVVTVILGLLIGMLAENSMEMVIISIVTGTVGAFAIWRAERSTNFVFAGVFVSLADFMAILAMRLIGGNYDPMGLATLAGASVVNGALSASLTFAAFSVMGSIFGITTVLQLLELAHPNQPLLRRLMREAPGTYHHSIVVSNLAEQAAELIGGDPLLVRVGAFYHDIGKVVRPYFFVENQANVENVHDRLDPKTSAQIIQNHVSDGVQLAQKSRLPNRIVDIVAQHHGDGLVGYFYHRATEQQTDVNPEDYRYPGPRPRSKEAALVMLADSVEAAVRAASQSGKFDAEGSNGAGERSAISETIALKVSQVIEARLAEGQLDECDLTLKDLDLIRRTFISILEGIYHPRIEYPGGTQQGNGGKKIARQAESGAR